MLLYYKDIVAVHFDHFKDGKGEKYEVEIHEVRERFGSNCRHKAMPLCKGIITKVVDQKRNEFSSDSHTVGKEIHFDHSFITHIVYRGNLASFPKINIYKRQYVQFKHLIQTKNKKVLCAPLLELCRVYLGYLNGQIIVQIDYEKLKRRAKSLTGVIDHYDIDRERYIFTVKKDHFKKWFKKNWRHILRTKHLENKLATEQINRENKAYEHEYFENYEKEELKKFSDDFKRQYDQPFLDNEF